MATASAGSVAQHPDGLIQEWLSHTGTNQASDVHFSWITFGTATTVLFALVAQIGEQVDFLRFLPEPDTSPGSKEKKKWWAAIIVAGPGWVVFGAIKLVLGTMLAVVLLQQGFSPEDAANPTHMYRVTFEYFSLSPQFALVLAAIFVIVCQIKINVANAYAGSLAWSNFFSRLTHHHPGRVVWLVFNVAIALMLMELGVYRAIETVLHHYSAFVLAWFGSIVADLIINKPLGLSPKHIEFKRSKLYDINPVGVGSTLLATIVGMLASTALLGESLAAFSGFIAFFLPFLTVPLIAYITQGKYYLVDKDDTANIVVRNVQAAGNSTSAKENLHCDVCQNQFDREDISHCPAYKGLICSLCCALETRCRDLCRPKAHLGAQLETFLRPLTGKRIYRLLVGPIGQFIFAFTIISVITASIFYLAYSPFSGAVNIDSGAIRQLLTTSFFMLLILLGVIVWLFILAQRSTRMALQEAGLQTQKLTTEVSAHKVTLNELERARKTADSANIAKSNYVTALSHELRTPLNVILGYAQLLQKDEKIPAGQKDNLSILHRNGEHLATMIEGLLEISKIEAGRLNLNADRVRLDLMLEQMVQMFQQQAEAKGLTFEYSYPNNLPTTIKVDEKRLRQILINLLSNAIKFTAKGSVRFSVSYRGHVAKFKISDTGYGISEEQLQDIFSPFFRSEDIERYQIAGSGLGLSICRQLADMMGADIEVSSQLGEGSTFTLLLQASPVETQIIEQDALKPITGYEGSDKTVLVIDDNNDHRRLLINLLRPIGFHVLEAADRESIRQNIGQKPDLVLLDVRLGSTSGWDIAKELRSQFDRLPIIMVSANARGFYSSLPNKKIHDDYLEKPLQLEALLEKMGVLLDLRWTYELDDKPGNQENTVDAKADGMTNNIADHNAELMSATSQLQHIIDLAKIGNLNDILLCLDSIEESGLMTSSTIGEFRLSAKRFDFDAVIELANELSI